jgi:hypothetical protein
LAAGRAAARAFGTPAQQKKEKLDAKLATRLPHVSTDQSVKYDYDTVDVRARRDGDKIHKRVHPQWPRTVVPEDDAHAFVAPVGSYEANAWGALVLP